MPASSEARDRVCNGRFKVAGEPQMPQGLKPARHNKKYRPLDAYLKVRTIRTSFFSAALRRERECLFS